jgi:copper ion binding protein
MHIEVVDGEEKLVCWMGPGCGVQDLPTHHDKPLILVTEENYARISPLSNELVCWMGPGCGVQDLPTHHDKKMKISSHTKPEKDNILSEKTKTQVDDKAKAFNVSSENLKVLDFAITGMTCASCVNAIESGVTNVEGVHQASVNLMTEKARILFDPSKTDVEKVRSSIESIGYGAKDISSSMDKPGKLVLKISGMTCASCVSTVEQSLLNVEGVKEVSVNLMTEKATISYDPSLSNVKTLITAVENVGYVAYSKA